MSTVSTREQFVKQLELILEGIKQNLTKVFKKTLSFLLLVEFF